MKYNNINVPPLIRTNRIMSAFENQIDTYKLQKYTRIMKAQMLGHDFPPIKGFPSIVHKNDLESHFLTGEPITEDLIGCIIWNVTDGHHRSLAAIEAGLPHLTVELDYTCITNPEELKQWNIL